MVELDELAGLVGLELDGFMVPGVVELLGERRVGLLDEPGLAGEFASARLIGLWAPGCELSAAEFVDVELCADGDGLVPGVLGDGVDRPGDRGGEVDGYVPEAVAGGDAGLVLEGEVGEVELWDVEVELGDVAVELWDVEVELGDVAVELGDVDELLCGEEPLLEVCAPAAAAATTNATASATELNVCLVMEGPSCWIGLRLRLSHGQ